MPNTSANPAKRTQRARTCRASPSGVDVPAVPASRSAEKGLELRLPTENANTPRDGCVSAANTCQLTMYVPGSAAPNPAFRTAPSLVTLAATCAPDGL